MLLVGIEPTTYALPRRCATTTLQQLFAKHGVRLPQPAPLCKQHVLSHRRLFMAPGAGPACFLIKEECQSRLNRHCRQLCRDDNIGYAEAEKK